MVTMGINMSHLDEDLYHIMTCVLLNINSNLSNCLSIWIVLLTTSILDSVTRHWFQNTSAWCSILKACQHAPCRYNNKLVSDGLHLKWFNHAPNKTIPGGPVHFVSFGGAPIHLRMPAPTFFMSSTCTIVITTITNDQRYRPNQEIRL